MMLPQAVFRAQPITAETRAKVAGSYVGWACGVGKCDRPPTLVLTTNAEVRVLCAQHLADILPEMVARAIREDVKYGFLVRPRKRQGPLAPQTPHMEYDRRHVLWKTALDEKYDVVVYRARMPRWGVLVVRLGEAVLAEEPVPLAYGAPFGPDVGDVGMWIARAIQIVDAKKSWRQRLDEAIARLREGDRLRMRALRRSRFAERVFRTALEYFPDADTAVEWMRTPTAALGGKSPGETLNEDSDVALALKLLRDLFADAYPLGDAPNV